MFLHALDTVPLFIAVQLIVAFAWNCAKADMALTALQHRLDMQN